MALSRLREADWRSSLMFFVGLGGVLHEAILRTVDRPTLLMLFGGMMGLPAFFSKDTKTEKKP